MSDELAFWLIVHFITVGLPVAFLICLVAAFAAAVREPQ